MSEDEHINYDGEIVELPDIEQVQAPIFAWKMASLYHTDAFDWHLRAMVTSPPFNVLDWNTTGKPDFLWDPFMGGQSDATPGFHSFTERDACMEYAASSSWFESPVLLKVELQGAVVEHEFGYRSEKFRVVEVHAPLETEAERQLLSDCIGWPFGIMAEPGLLHSWMPRFPHRDIPLKPAMAISYVTVEYCEQPCA